MRSYFAGIGIFRLVHQAWRMVGKVNLSEGVEIEKGAQSQSPKRPESYRQGKGKKTLAVAFAFEHISVGIPLALLYGICYWTGLVHIYHTPSSRQVKICVLFTVLRTDGLSYISQAEQDVIERTTQAPSSASSRGGLDLAILSSSPSALHILYR